MCVAAVGGVFVFYAWQKQLIWGMKMTKTVARAWSQAKIRSTELEFGEECCCIISCVWIRIYDNHLANIISVSLFPALPWSSCRTPFSRRVPQASQLATPAWLSPRWLGRFFSRCRQSKLLSHVFVDTIAISKIFLQPFIYVIVINTPQIRSYHKLSLYHSLPSPLPLLAPYSSCPSSR